MKRLRGFGALLAAVFLFGCGGGEGNLLPTTTATTVNMTKFKALHLGAAAGSQVSFKLSGSNSSEDAYTGSDTLVYVGATTFEGHNVTESQEIFSLTKTSTDITSIITNTMYFLESGQLYKQIDSTGLIGIPTSQTALPDIVHVGDSGNLNVISNSDGTIDTSTWKFEADVNNNYKITISTVNTDPNNFNNVVYSEDDCYHLDNSGNIIEYSLIANNYIYSGVNYNNSEVPSKITTIMSGDIDPTIIATTWLPTGYISGGKINVLAIDASNSQTIFAGTPGGVFRTTNGGGAWMPVLSNNIINVLAIDPKNSQAIYAGTVAGGVFKSTNGGDSWSQVNTGLTNMNIESLVIDPINNQTIYIGTGVGAGYTGENGGVFKSINGGDSWSSVGGLTNVQIPSLAIDPTNSQTIYAGPEDSGFKSTDGGNSWRTMDSGLPHIRISALVIDPANPKTIFAVNQEGLFKSTNGGNLWTEVPGLFASSLAIDPNDTQTIYAGVYAQGIFKSTNGGGSWGGVNSGLDSRVNFVAIDPTNSQIIYVGTDGGVFKTLPR